MYYARLSNLSLEPFDMEICDWEGGLARWDIQKWVAPPGRWYSLHGAGTWRAEPFGGAWRTNTDCSPLAVRIQPSQAYDVSWVYMGWVTIREPVRMAIHTRIRVPPEKQRIIYTETFIVSPVYPPAHFETDGAPHEF